MHEDLAQLLVYGGLNDDEILSGFFEASDWLSNGVDDKALLCKMWSLQIRRLIEFSIKHGFTGNLWHDYLVFRVLMDENSFTLTNERRAADPEMPLSRLAKRDFAVIRELFDFDFSFVEELCGLSFRKEIEDFHMERGAKKSAPQDEAVCSIARILASCGDTEAMYRIFAENCCDHGAGELGYSKAFRLAGTGDSLELRPIIGAETNRLCDIVGYEQQKRELVANTEAFLNGKPCNNVLLYGDAGTGKSTCVKALYTEYYGRGLRIIEIYKHQFKDISPLISRIKSRNYRFILFIDDLSFEEDENDYKFLKAVIEGGVETRPENVLIYATSNRRHLIRETWKDRSDLEYENEVHRSDTMEEKLSLSSRFGVSINFSQPTRAEYHSIVKTLALKHPEITMSDEELFVKADAWDIRHGGVSGRTAEQFVNYLAGQNNVGSNSNGNT